VTAVFYSIAPDADGRYESLWRRSAESLRRHNAHVPVAVCLYGDGPSSLLQAAAGLGVDILPMGPYAGLVADLPPAYAEVLGRHRCLHKLASLRRMAGHAPGHPLVYLDCDTHLFGDVEQLTTRSAEADWLAREEPGTARSRPGHHPTWVDEPALAGLAQAEGVVPVPPYNTGVFAVGAALASSLADLADEFLWYCWRLLAGAACGRPEVFFTDPAWGADVRAVAAAYDPRLQLPYPAQDIWIVDQVALWLLLGRVPGARHEMFATHEVSQSDEYLAPDCWPLLVHYFTAHAAAFEHYLAGLEPGPKVS
jgi:hypothetical protein